MEEKNINYPEAIVNEGSTNMKIMGPRYGRAWNLFDLSIIPKQKGAMLDDSNSQAKKYTRENKDC